MTLSVAEDDTTSSVAAKTMQQSLDDIREKLSLRGKTKVSLDVTKNLASDYLPQTADEEPMSS